MTVNDSFVLFYLFSLLTYFLGYSNWEMSFSHSIDLSLCCRIYWRWSLPAVIKQSHHEMTRFASLLLRVSDPRTNSSPFNIIHSKERLCVHDHYQNTRCQRNERESTVCLSSIIVISGPPIDPYERLFVSSSVEGAEMGRISQPEQ